MEKTLTNLFLEHTVKAGLDKEIFFTKGQNKYIPYTIKQLSENIYKVIKFFEEIDLKQNDKVAIVSESRVEWVVIDFACMFYGLVTVPVYPSLSNLQMKYILENSESKVCFVSNSLLLDKISSIRRELPELKEVVVFSDIDTYKYTKGKVMNFASIVNRKIKLSEGEVMIALNKLSERIKSDDLLTIIYTSGTTGIPKGVMLTHKNIYSNVLACKKVLSINEDDRFLSYLPYSHVYERTAGYYLAFFCGAKIYYAESIETIAKQLIETKPTMVITVPRLLDKIYNKLMKSGEEMENGLRKKLFLWAIDIAHNKNISKKNPKLKIADALVYKKIREKTGGSIRFFVSGGGALNKTIGEFFEKVGITVLEGYGMTEASPVISVNPPGKNKYGTVGIPLNGVTVKLSEENEIIVNGELVMAGYYKDEVNTNETIIGDWLHTGDIGEFDSEGYLKITDRKKSLIKTSGGKYVLPSQIEDLISRLRYVENVVVIGNERMYVTCLIVPDKNELNLLAKRNGINFNSYTDLLKNKPLHKIIQSDIDELLKGLSQHEQIRRFTLVEEPFGIESGELTPTMKVKRKFVEEKYKDEIEKMYLKI